jgi:hypothetical protein
VSSDFGDLAKNRIEPRSHGGKVKKNGRTQDTGSGGVIDVHGRAVFSFAIHGIL